MATKAVVGTAKVVKGPKRVSVSAGNELALERFVNDDGTTLQDQALEFLSACEAHGVKALLTFTDEGRCGVTFLGHVKKEELGRTLGKLSDLVYDSDLVTDFALDTRTEKMN